MTPAPFTSELAAELEQNVALAAHSFALVCLPRVAFQHFVIERESILRFVQLAFNYRLLIARCPFQLAVQAYDAIEQHNRFIERMRPHA